MTRFLKQLVRWLFNARNNFHNRFMFRLRKIDYDRFPTINGRMVLRVYGPMKLGSGITFNSGASANPIGGDTRMVIFVGKHGQLEIGDHTGISNSAIICQERISIGRHVKIGGSVKIYDTDFHSLDFRERKEKGTDIPRTRPITIGNYAFIGGHSIILKGVSIGDYSIVGAGSVVTKSIPAGEIWAGNPARFIKKVPNLSSKD